MSFKIIDGNDLPHELLTTRQKNFKKLVKFRNAFNNNMSTDMKLSKAQISKIIRPGGFLGSLSGLLMTVAVPLARKYCTPLGILLQQLMQDFKRKYMVLGQQP